MNPTPTASLISRVTRPLSVLILAFGACTASAQPGTSLPRSTVETIGVNPSQRTQIQEFVTNWSSRVTSEDAQDIKRGIEALTAPLQGRGVSVAFRQAYTQALNPLFSELKANESVANKLSLLRISADLATPTAVNNIQGLMSDDDHGVRLFAISRAGQVFETTRVHGPAMTGTDANALINAITDAAQQNADQHELIKACARALASGTTLGTRDLGDARSRAIIALSDLVGSRLQALNANEDPTFAQSLAFDAASATTRSISDITASVTAEAARAAVRLGGDIISVPLRRYLAKTLEPQNDRELTVRSVQTGETLLYFARRKAAELDGKTVNDIETTSFSSQLEAGDDRDFRNDAAALLGPGSPIVRTFGFDDDRFLR
ncbi:MAG: hypothetical protein CMJ35_09475 [Phycisphaerae bacterium]|nr:hypothetical protein [Phycisphaerae bacterium]